MASSPLIEMAAIFTLAGTFVMREAITVFTLISRATAASAGARRHAAFSATARRIQRDGPDGADDGAEARCDMLAVLMAVS